MATHGVLMQGIARTGAKPVTNPEFTYVLEP